MALAQADMLARNQLKLNLFSVLAYQEPGAAPLPRDLPAASTRWPSASRAVRKAADGWRPDPAWRPDDIA